jgi:hypothetical protein
MSVIMILLLFEPKATSAGLSIQLSHTPSSSEVGKFIHISSAPYEDVRSNESLAAYILRHGTRKW